MLHPGIKIGPSSWKERLQKTQAGYCEVWFNIDQKNQYLGMFQYLAKHKINTGLHFWGTVKNRWEPNIAYPGETLQPTLKLIKQTIDIASQYKFKYVNIHCGNRALTSLDIENSLFIPDKSKPIIDLKTSQEIQKRSAILLTKYARQKNVLLLIETVGAKSPLGPTTDRKSRLTPTDYFTLPVSTLINLTKTSDISVTNDISHTFADEFDKPLAKLSNALINKTKELAPATKLIHINTVVPPYNGTDSHHGITDKDFKISGIFPTRYKLKIILSLFNNRNDLWAINEPYDNHVQNYHSLQKIIEEITPIPGKKAS